MAPGNNVGMHLDHLSFAAGPDGLVATAQRLGAQLGAFSRRRVPSTVRHPQLDLPPLTGGQYLEVVGAGPILRRRRRPRRSGRSAQGGGWLGWVIAVDDLAPIEQRMVGPRSKATSSLARRVGADLAPARGQGPSGRSPASFLCGVVAQTRIHPSAVVARWSSSRSRSPVIKRGWINGWADAAKRSCPTSTSTGSAAGPGGLAVAIFSTPAVRCEFDPVAAAIAGLPTYTAGKQGSPRVMRPPSSCPAMRTPSHPSWRDRGHRAAVARMNRYPDIANSEMTHALSSRLGVAGEQLAFATGSVAVLYHLLQATCEAGDEVVYAWRSFEAYPIAVPLTGATSVPVPLGPGAVRSEAMRVLSIATGDHALHVPNNPTGPRCSINR